jgi:hypothetical protein
MKPPHLREMNLLTASWPGRTSYGIGPVLLTLLLRSARAVFFALLSALPERPAHVAIAGLEIHALRYVARSWRGATRQVG